jgi:hypothetical protein
MHIYRVFGLENQLILLDEMIHYRAPLKFSEMISLLILVLILSLREIKFKMVIDQFTPFHISNKRTKECGMMMGYYTYTN